MAYFMQGLIKLIMLILNAVETVSDCTRICPFVAKLHSLILRVQKSAISPCYGEVPTRTLEQSDAAKRRIFGVNDGGASQN